MRAGFETWRVGLAVFAVGAGLWASLWWSERQRAGERAAMREQLADLEKRNREAALDLSAAKRETGKGQQERDEAWRREGKARKALEKVDPDARWSQPPTGTPRWDPKSPYVWLPKGEMTNMGMTVFTKEGRLTDESAKAFAVDADTRKKLEAELTGYVSAFQTIEAYSAERTATNGQEITVRIKAMPDEASQFASEMEGSLQSELGAQRAEMLMQMGQRWLAEFGTEEKTYEVEPANDGNLSVRVNTAGSSMSTEVTTNSAAALGNYIPSNLLSLFVTDGN